MDIELIPLKAEHLEMVRKWRNSPEVSSYMYTSAEISEEQQKAWFQKISAENDSRYWVISFDGKYLGLASVTGINYTLGSCYWAFYLGDTSVRGGGIGAKTEYNVIEYVFNELRLNKLRCEVFTTNEKVVRMHEKFGFRREAYYREHCIKDGEKLDVVGLALLKSDWDLLREGYLRKLYGSHAG